MTHHITPVEGDLADLLNKYWINQTCTGFVRVDGILLVKNYEHFAHAIENFEVRDDDIWVCSFPKTGTTWTQEMVWCIANDLDFERARVPLRERFPFFDFSSLTELTEMKLRNPDLQIPKHIEDSVSFVGDLPSPRFIKTHLPFNLLPRQLRTGEKKPKIIYVVRNAKDTCISYFHHSTVLDGFTGSFEDFCTLFIGDTVIYAPFWEHAVGYWKNRMNENLLLLKYEDMKTDLPRIIKETATFLGKRLTTEQLSTLTEHLSFTSMKANAAVNNEDLIAETKQVTNSKGKGQFMRSGKVDQWKTEMSPAIIERFDNWTRESLKDSGLFY